MKRKQRGYFDFDVRAILLVLFVLLFLAGLAMGGVLL